VAVRFQPKMPLWGRCRPHPHQAVDRLVTASSDGMIRIWDLAKRTTLHTIQVHLGIVSGLHLVRGRFIVSSSEVDADESEVQ